ncbi:MAG: GtrA family protein [Actinomycetota bacterium]
MAIRHRFSSLAELPLVRKTFRYASVSAISLTIGQALLITFHKFLHWPGTTANIVSVVLSAIPSYWLNRYWTWDKRGRNDLWREIVPFWSMALLGLGFSTWLVAIAERRWGTTLAVSAASLMAFGTIWVGKFVILNSVLFPQRVDKSL